MKTLNPTISQFINQIIPHNRPQNRGRGQAPVNIALSKYWGKRDTVLNLPINSSLSISLPGLGTETEIRWDSTLAKAQVSLNHQQLSEQDPFAKRISHYLDYFLPDQAGHFIVETINSVPTAAGLASSASGYAALVLALNDLFQWQFSPKNLSLLARLGSGSATRSLFEGFAIWHKGEQADGLDSYAESIKTVWDEFCVGLLEIDLSEKSIPSTTGMQQTVQTCELYKAWPEKAEADLKLIAAAIQQHDFPTLGKTAENNALSMHATMIATWPPILYWQPDSVQAMQRVWQLRQSGIEVYFTMDAGPNLKLLFLEKDLAEIQAGFKQMKVIQPFRKDSPITKK